MSNPNDPNLEIKLKTLGGTEADRQLKQVEDRLKSIDAAEQKLLKTQRVFGDESEQMANHLSKLTKEAKASGAAAQEVTGIKGRWLAALKQLKNDVPGLGTALNALKNPFTAIIAVIALMVNWLQQINAEIKEFQDIVGTGKIADQFKNIAQALADANSRAQQFARTLAEIEGRGETPEQQKNRMLADFDRKLKEEEAADPEGIGKAGRAQRRLDFMGHLEAQAMFRSRDVLREGQSRFPAMNEELRKAQVKRDEQFALADSRTTSDAQLAALDKQIALMEDPGMSKFRLQRTYGGEANMAAALAAKKEARESIRRQNEQAIAIRGAAQDEFNAVQGRYNAFVQSVSGAAENVRNYSASRTAAVADAASALTYNDPTAGARSKAAAQAQAQAELALERFFQRITRMSEQYDAKLRSQSQSSR